ncbi:retropepsin-like aspartic protease [Heliorestis acidaminivorans]|uniref:retropepsin-like aspartic protease n=1 Tax=Heliorestis acidaminivorans TaxID=553427 RepID=UPI001FA9C92A|nr:retropepsin-like aspartic protease [Heliorestis acidaminivorans]
MSIKLVYQGRSKVIDNMVIDTGAAKTLISQNAVDDIDLRVESGDHIVTYYGIGGKEHAYTKQVDSIHIGSLQLKDRKLDFSGMDYEGIDGLLGLDVLLDAGFIIDLKKLEMYR